MACFRLKPGTPMKSKNCCSALMLVLPLSLFTFGCDRTNQDNSTSSPSVNSTDNSGINVRDRNTNNLTAGDQGNSQADVDLTQKIRKSLMDSNYSVTAKNVKIITANGNVTLRGPVNSEDEKTGIGTLAKNAASAGQVDNQLEVKNNP
jgi:hyperosmotically inducible protein